MATSDWELSEVNATSKAMDKPQIAYRFRGYLPVVVDIETAGFNPKTDAMLEIAVTTLDMDEDGTLSVKETHAFDVEPFEGANLEQAALDFTGIDPEDPLRAAYDEQHVLGELFRLIRREVKQSNCKRAIVVAHNASFDHQFLNAAVDRCGIKRNPFHPFSSIDTASLAGLAFGHTVLAQACRIANIQFDNAAAHSAAYDSEVTARLFCQIVNQWRDMGGWDKAVEGHMRLAEKEGTE
ncbi:Ribonuclease T [BD1-7 clade bacterium]|uniref:Ribonuclease T n=1 Tax=BD1-7 clade bacterium TaxID=2029982 RepID=A0A5S9PSV1_9GAMM|nr:Ribonuclease T [BD1-7 clade bacterium]